MIRVPKACTSGNELPIDINIYIRSAEKSRLNQWEKEDLEVNCIDDEEIARIAGFCQAAEMDFHHLARPRNVSIDLIFCACECLCSVYPLESEFPTRFGCNSEVLVSSGVASYRVWPEETSEVLIRRMK